MVDPLLVLRSVALLFFMIIPGFILRKTGLAEGGLAKGLANTIIYVAQPAMIIAAYIRPFDVEVLKTAAGVFALSLAVHGLFYGIVFRMYGREPEAQRRVYRYATIFSNAGYMGLPLIVALLGDEAAIYCSFYVIGFNIFSWSLGSYLFSGDRKYISVRKIFLNPATIPTYVGLLIFFLRIDGYVPALVTDALDMLKATVAPLSMIMIGIRLAEVPLKGAFRGKSIWGFLAMRLLALPAAVFLLLYGLKLLGYYDATVAAVVLVCASTPSAAMTGMFAERYNGDAPLASKLVSVSTVFSIVTMPVVAMLLQLL